MPKLRICCRLAFGSYPAPKQRIELDGLQPPIALAALEHQLTVTLTRTMIDQPAATLKKSSPSTFAIVIPAYNEERNLGRLLASIGVQAESSYSIVVVDHGSSDRTAEIARSNGCTVVSVTRPAFPTPPGPSRNVGALSIEGRILLHLDADMELGSRDFLKKLETLIDPEHQAAVIHERDVATGFWARCKALERSCYIGTPIEAPRAVTREIFERVGGYDQQISTGEDLFITTIYERETCLVSDESLVILHYTGPYTLASLLAKKIRYGKTVKTYLARAQTVGAKSGGAIIRAAMSAYVRNWRLIYKHPILFVCIFPIRFMEFLAVQVGMWLAAREDASRLPRSERPRS